MVRPDDFSMKGRLLRFLGLEKQIGEPFPKAAPTWEDPMKMLESLNYYDDLTHKGGTHIDAVPKVIEPAPEVPVPEPAEGPAKRAAAPRPPAAKPSAPQPDKPGTAGLAAGQYTLRVALLREPDAQVLIEKLKLRGYSPRVESLDLGAAKWTRVLLGSFPSREAAIMFATRSHAVKCRHLYYRVLHKSIIRGKPGSSGREQFELNRERGAGSKSFPLPASCFLLPASIFV